MSEPRATRPHMPGYGLPGPDDPSGLLAWSWAEERLLASYRYWVATAGPTTGPHAMPVWGVWFDRSLWFSTGGRTRKVANLNADSRCVVTTEDAAEAVVVEGSAEVASSAPELADVIEGYRAKYPMDPPDVADSPILRVRPRIAFGLVEDPERFSANATRWVFDR